MAFREHALITKVSNLATGVYEMWFKTENIAKEAKPGQFIHMKVNDPRYLLRRPISIAGTDPEKGLMNFLKCRLENILIFKVL